MQFLSKQGGVTIHFDCLQKLTPYCKGFQVNPLRIDGDIDDFVQFLSKQGGVTIHFDRLEKLTPYCKGFKQIR